MANKTIFLTVLKSILFLALKIRGDVRKQNLTFVFRRLQGVPQITFDNPYFSIPFKVLSSEMDPAEIRLIR